MKRYVVALFLFGMSVSSFSHAQCAAFPCVVASVTLTNQNQPIRSTPIFTPIANGLFRISAYLSTARAHTPNADWLAVFDWTDDNGPMEAQTVAFQRSSNAFIATSVIEDVAGQPVLYKTRPQNGAGGTNGMTYNLYIVVEQLQ